MDIDVVKTSYARWAPVYDMTFGAVTQRGRRRTVATLNRLGPRVLEVGVGTGLALGFYNADKQVTGIDFSADMLDKAREKVATKNLSHVESLMQMDARSLQFPDAHFDVVVAMHVVSVVPEPERVVAEMARVCKPGGRVVITNHFARSKGLLARIEKLAEPISHVLGWHSDFEIGRVLGEESLTLRERRSFPPLGLMTYLQLERQPG